MTSDLAPSPSPTGIATFLFTDIEGSTKRWEANPESMGALIAKHDEILRRAIGGKGGLIFKMVGDGCYAAFSNAGDALSAGLAVQKAVSDEFSNDDEPIRVRVALHTGAAEYRDGDYFGQPLNRTARLLSSGYGGQILLSSVTQQLVRDQLPDGVSLKDLGEHRFKDLTQPERVFQVLAADLRRDFPALNSLDARATNLPPQPTPFIGREQEVRDVGDIIRGGARLVTLTGPGGTGKTRLALQVGGELVEECEHGVYFVALAAVADAELVADTISSTLGLREEPGRSARETLLAHLASKNLLLVIDNFEQVVEAAHLIGEILQECPRVSLIITSRAALRLYGEHTYSVPPLQLPDLAQLQSLDAVAGYESVALFLQRAAAAKRGFALTEETVRPIAEICCRLDGLPLAIELAAARINVLTPRALLERLSAHLGGLKLLTRGATNLPGRQQTLRAAIEWSYDLLEETEQNLFRHSSVFAGGWTLEAAEAVCNVDGDLDILDATASLVDKSLFTSAESGDQPRFGMLATIRDYALERLEMMGAGETVRNGHAAYYIEFAEDAARNLEGAEQEVWLRLLEAEHGNIRAALHHLLDRRDAKGVARLAIAASRFWKMHSHFEEGGRWLAQALELGDLDATTRGQLLYRAGSMAAAQYDWPEAERLQMEALAVAQATGDKSTAADALNVLGSAALAHGSFESASEYFRQALAMNSELGDAWGMAVCMMNLGNTATNLGNLDEARRWYRESLEGWRRLGDTWGNAFCLVLLAYLAVDTGDLTEAANLADEGLELFRTLGARFEEAYAMSVLGLARAGLGDCRQAEELLTGSLAACHELGNAEQTLSCLQNLLTALALQGRIREAAPLWGALDALRRNAGISLDRSERERYERDVAKARAELGEAAWQVAWQDGQKLTLEAAVEAALGLREEGSVLAQPGPVT